MREKGSKMKFQKFISALCAIAIGLMFALQLSQTIPARGQTENEFSTIASAQTATAESAAETQTLRSEQSFAGDPVKQPGEAMNDLTSKSPNERQAHKRHNLNLRL